MRLTVTAASPITVDLKRRTLTGTVYRYGEIGQTSAGPLQVGPSLPAPPVGLGLTLEHDRDIVRAHIALVDASDERLRVSCRVVDGPLGDAALAEAMNRKRAGFSFDLEDVDVVDGVIVAGTWAFLGQVENPAFNSARIDQIAASSTPAAPNQEGTTVTDEQRARLDELRAKTELTPEEQAELETLVVLESADPAVAADPAAVPAAAQASRPAVPAVPAGVPTPVGVVASVRETPANALHRMFREVAEGVRSQNVSAITAALADITHTAHTDNIEELAWSGELWSGLQYVPEWSDLLTQGTLTHWEGKGWRFTNKLEIKDYAGDKAEVPTDTVTTESSSYEAARAALGIDVDRKFWDFPNAAFVQALFEQVRESWEILKDGKSRAYILANAVAATRPLSVTTANGDATVEAANGSFTAADVGSTITGTGIPGAATILSVTDSGTIELSANATASGTITATIGAAAGTLLKAAARSSMTLKRRRVGKADWVMANDEDMFTLLDVAEKDVPAFLQLWGIAPEDFRSSPDVPQGTLLAGVRKAAIFRQLPGSPIRVEAQNIARAGVDQGFFGYWAIEEHHTSGIASVKFNRPA